MAVIQSISNLEPSIISQIDLKNSVNPNNVLIIGVTIKKNTFCIVHERTLSVKNVKMSQNIYLNTS